ncbi:PAS domain-containing sensor histidine kinase [Maridesulfovibrio hydrothermalis]|uniref:histidine kinase n=1 Tax=Maridesulfovibrio hydrothermalis AM13 = DSM 14728 TaxID=1121451 RepID=L0RFM9_9BACT|nr:PAS domain S-box protein [Maridesulfovibrio hydrothermalis]CCO25027.1 PAS/PAC sensor signal transduction histidine kinase [Maridesulfovibrio hydrothermalis AM13 = DSM 14728]
MKRRSDDTKKESVRNKLIGLGENSMRKSYYPELKERLNELERFRALVEYANDALFVLDAFSWSFADVNRTALKKTDYTREELLDSPPELVFPEDTCFLLHEVLIDDEVYSSWEKEDVSTTELLGKGGSKIPVEMTLKVHFVGGRLYIVMVARDVRRRLADQRELRRTRNYLGNVIDSMQSTLVGVDGSANVVLWNAHAAEETGISAEYAQGRFIFEVMPELRRFENLISRTIQGRQGGGTEIFHVERGQGTTFFEIVVFPFINEDESGAVIRVDDITARTRMEEVMVQTEKMMTVGGLAAGMAHEINNPLGGILQGTQNVLRRISSDLKKNHTVAEEVGIPFESIHEYCEKRGIIPKLESIQQLGERSARIVSNMLQFSRQSGGEKVCADIAQVVEAAIELSFSGYDLYHKSGDDGVEIIRELDRSIPDILCSPSEIEQVMINLIKNSVQAILSDPKRVEGRLGRIVVRLKPEKGFVRLEIEDNGPGMDAETRKNALEPFFTTKAAGEGTGLGLFVSYFIVTQKHNGTFVIETSYGKGMKVIIRLPSTCDCQHDDNCS